MDRPLLPAAVGFIAGIAVTSAAPPAGRNILILILVLLALTGAGLFFISSPGGAPSRRRTTAVVLILIGALCLGFLRWCVHSLQLEAAGHERWSSAELILLAVESPQRTSTGGYRWEALVREVVDGPDGSVGNRLLIYSPEPVSVGGYYRVVGDIFPQGSPRNPGQFDYRRYLLNRGISHCLSVRVMEPADGPTRLWPDLVLAARGFLRARILQRVSDIGEDAAGLGVALICGERDLIRDELAEAFRAAGLGHLLAVSGLHVMMFGLSVLWILEKVLPRRAAVVPGLVFVFGYSGLAGGGPSVSRAALLFAARATAPLLMRRYDPLNVLAAAALLLVAGRPGLVFDVGFQLSFAACLSLVSVRPALVQRMKWIPWGLGEALGTTLAAHVAVFPLVLYHFEASSLLGLIVNPLVTPVFGLVLASTWICTGAAALGMPRVILSASAVPASALARTVRLLGRVPVVVELTLDLSALVCVYLAVGLVMVVWFRRREGPLPEASRRRMRVLTALLLVWVLTTGVLLTLPLSGTGVLRVTVFDVGQGDCILFEVPGGGTFMIDTGPRTRDGVPLLESRVLPYLQDRRIDRIDYLLLTHGHADHTGGAVALLDAVEVGQLWYGPMCESGAGLESDPEIDRAVRDHGVEMRKVGEGHSIQLGDAVFTVLWPVPEAEGVLCLNGASVAVRVEYGEWAMLNMADVEGLGENWMVDLHGSALNAEVLKVGHHGAPAGSGSGLLEVVQPVLAVIPVGANPYGHPSPTTLERLQEAGATTVTTRDSGAVILETDGYRWRISSMIPVERLYHGRISAGG